MRVDPARMSRAVPEDTGSTVDFSVRTVGQKFFVTAAADDGLYGRDDKGGN